MVSKSHVSIFFPWCIYRIWFAFNTLVENNSLVFHFHIFYNIFIILFYFHVCDSEGVIIMDIFLWTKNSNSSLYFFTIYKLICASHLIFFLVYFPLFSFFVLLSFPFKFKKKSPVLVSYIFLTLFIRGNIPFLVYLCFPFLFIFFNIITPICFLFFILVSYFYFLLFFFFFVLLSLSFFCI